MRHLQQKRFAQCIVGLSLTGLLFLSSCSKNDDQPVARVGGRTITSSEFDQAFSKGKT